VTVAAVLLFVSLGLDTLAVAVGLGLAGLARSRWASVGFTFALFEGLMPLVGLVIGRGLTNELGALAGYVAAGVLIVVGLLTVREALSGDEDKITVIPEGHRLLLTGLSVSLDEVAVGFSLGTLRVPLVPALIYVGAQAFVFTFIGLSMGRRIGARLGEMAELAAGVVLTLLGVALLVSQATGRQFPLPPTKMTRSSPSSPWPSVPLRVSVLIWKCFPISFEPSTHASR
jgi:manganese efflux pump family protein